MFNFQKYISSVNELVDAIIVNQLYQESSRVEIALYEIDSFPTTELKEINQHLQKANPMPVTVKVYDDVKKYTCPCKCNIQLSPVTQNNYIHEHIFCPRCGQKLDWSIINNE